MFVGDIKNVRKFSLQVIAKKVGSKLRKMEESSDRIERKI